MNSSISNNNKNPNKKAKEAKKIKQAVKKEVRREVTTRPHQALPRANGPYRQMLSRPFLENLKPLGFGTAVPTTCVSVYRRAAIAPPSNATSVVVIMRPQLPGMVLVYTGINDSAAINTTSAAVYDASNQAMVVSMAQMGRIINAGLRVKVKYAATEPPGQFGAFYTHSDSYSNLLTNSPSGLMSLSGAEWDSTTSGQSMAMEVQYRPLDLTSYSFTNTFRTGWVNSVIQPLLIIVMTGWVPGRFNIEFSATMGLETLGGLLSGSIDSSRAGPGSVDEALRASETAGPTILDLDSVADYAVKGATVISKLHRAYAAVQTAHEMFAAAQRIATPPDPPDGTAPVLPAPDLDPNKPDHTIDPPSPIYRREISDSEYVDLRTAIGAAAAAPKPSPRVDGFLSPRR